MSKNVVTHPHTITFSGRMPADEMERASLFGNHPEINEARKTLEAALAKAGYPHEVVSHVTRPRVRKEVSPVDVA